MAEAFPHPEVEDSFYVPLLMIDYVRCSEFDEEESEPDLEAKEEEPSVVTCDEKLSIQELAESKPSEGGNEILAAINVPVQSLPPLSEDMNANYAKALENIAKKSSKSADDPEYTNWINAKYVELSSYPRENLPASRPRWVQTRRYAVPVTEYRINIQPCQDALEQFETMCVDVEKRFIDKVFRANTDSQEELLRLTFSEYFDLWMEAKNIQHILHSYVFEGKRLFIDFHTMLTNAPRGLRCNYVRRLDTCMSLLSQLLKLNGEKIERLHELQNSTGPPMSSSLGFAASNRSHYARFVVPKMPLSPSDSARKRVRTIGIASPKTAPPFGNAAPKLTPPFGIAAPKLTPPFGIAASKLTPPFGIAASKLTPPFGIAAPELAPPVGIAAPAKAQPSRSATLETSSSSSFAFPETSSSSSFSFPGTSLPHSSTAPKTSTAFTFTSSTTSTVFRFTAPKTSTSFRFTAPDTSVPFLFTAPESSPVFRFATPEMPPAFKFSPPKAPTALDCASSERSTETCTFTSKTHCCTSDLELAGSVDALKLSVEECDVSSSDEANMDQDDTKIPKRPPGIPPFDANGRRCILYSVSKTELETNIEPCIQHIQTFEKQCEVMKPKETYPHMCANIETCGELQNLPPETLECLNKEMKELLDVLEFVIEQEVAKHEEFKARLEQAPSWVRTNLLNKFKECVDLLDRLLVFHQANKTKVEEALSQVKV